MKINLHQLASLANELKKREGSDQGVLSIATIDKMIDYLLYQPDNSFDDDTTTDDELDLNTLIIKNTLVEYGILELNSDSTKTKTTKPNNNRSSKK